MCGGHTGTDDALFRVSEHIIYEYPIKTAVSSLFGHRFLSIAALGCASRLHDFELVVAYE